MAICGAAVTPVLQSHGQVGLVTSKKFRHGFSLMRSPLRGEQQIEVHVLSVQAAELALQDMDPGAVLPFINVEPVQGRSGSLGKGRSARHQLFISFKYRRTLIHFDYYWVQLKLVDRGRRTVFHVEQNQFEMVVGLINVFVPTLRAWLSAIVKAANFIDQPVESVDLRQLLRARHHLLLTRSTATIHQGVVLCKLDPESKKKIFSNSIVFDFEARQIRDDSGEVQSFHEVFQQFLGLNFGYGYPLPSPREEDEEEAQVALGLIEGLGSEKDPELKLKCALRLQGLVRKELGQRRGGAGSKFDNLELMTTLLLPQLIHCHAVSGSPEPTPRAPGPLGSHAQLAGSGGGDATTAVGADSARGAAGESFDAPFSKIQVIIGDILADLCDSQPDAVGPHVWRVSRDYLEDARTWHACLVALELLTLLSPRLAEWLVQHTDVVTRLVGLLVESHQLLNSQREVALAAIGRAPQPLQPPRQWPPPPRPPDPRLSGRSGGEQSRDWSSPSSEPQPRTRPSPRISPAPPLPQMPDHVIEDASTVAASSASPAAAEVRSFAANCVIDVGWGSSRSSLSHRGPAGPSPTSGGRRRAPSFDNFDGPKDGSAGASASARRGGSRSEASLPPASPNARRPSRETSGVDAGCIGSEAAEGTVAGRSTSGRPMRVPPLNLDLASRLPVANASPRLASAAAAANAASTPVALASPHPSSMTRSTRRLQRKQKEMMDKASQPPGGASAASGSQLGGSASRSTPTLLSAWHSFSAPLLNLRMPLLGACTPASSSSAGAACMPQVVSTGAMKGAAASQSGMAYGGLAATQRADDMAVALGEAALLADLSFILKYTQERQVQDALLGSMRPTLSSCSPAKTGGRATPPLPGGRHTPPVSRLAQPGGGGVAPSNPSPRAPTTATPRAPRLLPLRRVRWHAGSILCRFCECGPLSVGVVGPHVPVNKLFEMLQASCARSGACSFAFADDGESDDPATLLHGGAAGALAEAGGVGAALRGGASLLPQRMAPERLRRYTGLGEQMRKGSTARRCVCGAAAACRDGRGAADDFCSCVDDMLAGCIWQLLGAHARHVESLHAHALGAGAWSGLSSTWCARAALDAFLTRLSRTIAQMLQQLRSAQNATTAGPEAIESLQHRMAFLLRLGAAYTRRCARRSLSLQAFEVLRPTLLAVKHHLCVSTDVTGKAPLPLPVVRLWVAYLQLIGSLLRAGAPSGGLHAAAFIEVVAVTLLDFTPGTGSPLAESSRAPFAANRSERGGSWSSYSPSSTGARGACTTLAGGAPGTPGSQRDGDPRRLPKSHSVRALHQGGSWSSNGSAAGPPRLPSGALLSPHSPHVGGAAAPPVSLSLGTRGVLGGGGATIRSVILLLPRVLERALCDTIGDDVNGYGQSLAQAARLRAAPIGEDGAESLRCRALGFVEALLLAGQALGPAPAAAAATRAADAFIDGRDKAPPAAVVGVVSAACGQEDFRGRSEAAGEALLQSVLDWLQFMFLPPSGLLCRMKVPLVGGPVVMRRVLCERALFQARPVSETIYVRDAPVAEYYVRRHFLNFVRLYNCNLAHPAPERLADDFRRHCLRLCVLHLETLLALASFESGFEVPRRAFHRLSVLDFLAGEIDLEHETTQMRDRFIRAAAKGGGSIGSVGSGSCTSSPTPARLSCSSLPSVPPFAPSGLYGLSGGSGGRSTPGLAVNSALPPGAAQGSAQLPQAADMQDSSDSDPEPAASAGHAPSPSVAPIPIPMAPMSMGGSLSLSLGTKPRAVPKLQFRGVRPSMQGCSGLGAPPPEEPGYDGVSGVSAPPTMHAHPAPGPAPHPHAAMPKLHAGAPGEMQAARAAGLSALAPVNEPLNEPGGSCTSSTAASPRSLAASPSAEGPQSWHAPPPHEASQALRQAAGEPWEDVSDVAAEAPIRRQPPVVPRLSMPGAGGPGREASDGSDGPGGTDVSVVQSPATSRSTAVSSAFASDRQNLMLGGINPATRAVAPGRPSQQGVSAVAVFTPSPGTTSGTTAQPGIESRPITDEDSSSSGGSSPAARSGSQPRIMPLVSTCFTKFVPKLSFFGVRQSMQGTSGLGAPPPEEPGQETLCAMFAPESGPCGVTSSAPLHNTSVNLQVSSLRAAGFGDYAHPLSPPPPSNSDSSDSSPGPREQREALSPQLPAHASDDGSSAASPVSPGALALAPAEAVARGEDYDSSSDEDLRSQGGLVHGQTSGSMPELPPGPILHSSSFAPCSMGRPAGKAVPSLSFKGIRPSLQGSSGLGAPPPEEPDTNGMPTSHHAKPPMVTPLVTPPARRGGGAFSPPWGGAVEHPSASMLSSSMLGAVAEGGGRGVSLTPRGSGCLSPHAGSTASLPPGGGAGGAGEAQAQPASYLVRENVFYFAARARRHIYDDIDLHSLMLTLILALLATPRKGLLDSRYCDQYPSQTMKRNIPFLLSVHLNHNANRPVLPALSQQVERISHIGGFRLLKLLCQTAMHRWMYTNKVRVAGGQFGTVYQCGVKLNERETVAVKQIPVQTAIQDRCVFFDVFSEVACLDAVRYESHVCQIYDYGVDETSYWIVMKCYSTTLSKWRASLQGSMGENLPVLLAVFKQILLAVHTLHWHGIVHYDLKCDNIMVDMERVGGPTAPRVQLLGAPLEEDVHMGEGSSRDWGLSSATWASPVKEEEEPSSLDGAGGSDVHMRVAEDSAVARHEESAPRIALADFGESRMFGDPDEVDTRNRGTELIKGPEMLEIANVAKREGNNFDRRRRIGTDKSADMWSLGCLCFEVMTGCYLFGEDDMSTFWARVMGKMHTADGDVVSQANCRRLENNASLIELIRYMMVRNPQQRPSIEAVIRKYESLANEALNEDGEVLDRQTSSSSMVYRDVDSPRSTAHSQGGSSGGGARSETPARVGLPLVCLPAAGEGESYFFSKVLRDLAVLEVGEGDDGSLRRELARCTWTHVVDFRATGPVDQLDVPYAFSLPWSSPTRATEELIDFLPDIFDFLRHAAIQRGSVLLVDGHSSTTTAVGVADPGEAAGLGGAEAAGAGGGGRGGMAMAAVLAVFGEAYRMAAYHALSFLSSQLLVAAIQPDALAAVARWQESQRFLAWRQCEESIRVACLCGACSWHVPAAWLDLAAVEDGQASATWPGASPCLAACRCSGRRPPCEAARCPSRGTCDSYTRWFHARYGARLSCVHWLWLPAGVGAAAVSDTAPRADEAAEAPGEVTRGAVACAEPVAGADVALPGGAAAAEGEVVRYRCRYCQVLTHAEVSQVALGSAGDAAHAALSPRVALVLSYELLRLAAAGEAGEEPTSGSRGRPPVNLHRTSLDRVVLPAPQAKLRRVATLSTASSPGALGAGAAPPTLPPHAAARR